MSDNEQNPYQTPEAELQQETNNLLHEPARVSAGRGFTWLEGSLNQIIKPSIGTWLLIGLVYFIILFALNLVPLIGPIAQYLLVPVFTAGLLLGCKKITEGNKLEINDLFSGFQLPQSGQLFVFGLINLVIYLGVFILIIGIIGFEFFGAALSGQEPDADAIAGMMGKFFLLIPLFLILGILIALAVWFPPALIGIHNMSAIEAIKHGFRGALKNIGAILVLFLMMIVLSIVLMIVLGIIFGILTIISNWLAGVIGMVVFLLFIFLFIGFSTGVTYMAYRDIFIGEQE